MTISVIWDNPEKTTIRFIFEGKWKLDDLYPVLDEHSTMMSSIDHIVDAIVDMRASPVIPSNVLSIRSRQERKRPQNNGISVVVGGGAFVKTIALMYQKLVSTNMSMNFADTLEEAREIIEKNRNPVTL